MSFNRTDALDEHVNKIIVANLILTLFVMFMLLKQKGPQINYLSSSKPDVKIKDLKHSICFEAFNGWKDGFVNHDLFSKSVVKEIRRSSSEYLKLDNIKEVYPTMKSDDVCRIIFKRKKGFTGVDAILTKSDPFGFAITSILPVKLTTDDVKEYL